MNENPAGVRVADGHIVVNGERGHLFYDGPVYHHSFKNFELRALVRTKPNANSGIYFHTVFQQDDWPRKGYEVQINNSQGDWRRTAGLYGIEDVKVPPANDEQWFLVQIRVEGKRITTSIDGKQIVDYTEPDGVKRDGGFEGRLIDRGTFALQAHDPGSEVWYKAIAVRPLPE
jgi:hypothetical protein